jgi:hypothetical protein
MRSSREIVLTNAGFVRQCGVGHLSVGLHATAFENWNFGARARDRAPRCMRGQPATARSRLCSRRAARSAHGSHRRAPGLRLRLAARPLGLRGWRLRLGARSLGAPRRSSSLGGRPLGARSQWLVLHRGSLALAEREMPEPARCRLGHFCVASYSPIPPAARSNCAPSDCASVTGASQT